MPRRSRRDAPGRLHHIVNRGIAKRVVFPDHAAKRRFILLLACAVRRDEIEVEALCVMDTHFLLLARSPEGRIHYPMMRILNSYSRYFNRRFRRDGPVFRGRYRSWPVLTFAYWRTLVRYIDFNPVKAGVSREPASYRYGTARIYVLRTARPRWLTRRTVEAHVAYCVRKDGFRGADYLLVSGQVLTRVRRREHSWQIADLTLQRSNEPRPGLRTRNKRTRLRTSTSPSATKA